MDIGITKMSSKGQIVIPQDMRENFAEGDKLIVIRDEDRLVLRKASKLDSQFLEDLEFAKRSDEAYDRIQKGEGIEMDFDEFIEEMKKWWEQLRIIFDNYYKKKFDKINNKELKLKIIKQILKLKENPELGKPMRYSRKGSRELYISPFRLSYLYLEDKIKILDLYHKDEQ